MSFKSMHRTSDGANLLIATMETNHIINTVNMFVRFAEDASRRFDTAVASNSVGDTSPHGLAMRQIYNLPKPLSLEQETANYAKLIDEYSVRLQDYLLELFTRELTPNQGMALCEASKRWMVAVKRSERIRNPNQPLLNGKVEDFVDDDEVPF